MLDIYSFARIGTSSSLDGRGRDDEVGHTWDNFKRLAVQAIAIGIYTRVDFDAEAQPYCGISISSSVV
jgi:hypothetical protein